MEKELKEYFNARENLFKTLGIDDSGWTVQDCTVKMFSIDDDVLRFADNVEQFAFAEYVEYAIDSPEKIKRDDNSVIVFCRHSSGVFDHLVFSSANEIKKIDSQ